MAGIELQCHHDRVGRKQNMQRLFSSTLSRVLVNGIARSCRTMDIYQVIFPFYLISKLTGYSCFGLSYNSASLPLKKKRLHLLSNCLLIAVNIFLNLQQMVFAQYFAQNIFTTVTGRILSKSLFNVNGVMYTISILVSLLVRNKTRLFVKKLLQFDTIYCQYFAPMDYHKHRRHLLYYLMIVFTLASVLVAGFMLAVDRGSSKFKLDKSYLYFLFFCIVSIVNYSVLLSHITLALAAVHVRFRSINNNIMLEPKQPKKYNKALIRSCRTMHDLLNDCVELVNSCFAFHAMWCTLGCFGFNLMSLYADYEIFMAGKNYIDIYLSMAWNASFTVQNILVITACSRVRAQAADTATVIHHLMNDIDDPELIAEVKHEY